MFTLPLPRNMTKSKRAISGSEYLKFVYSFCKKYDQMQKKAIYLDQKVFKYTVENVSEKKVPRKQYQGQSI